MNKRQLTAAVADRLGDEELAADAVAAFLDTIAARVAAGETVKVVGFGKFSRVQRPARAYRNPAGNVAIVPATYVPKFKAGADFKRVAAARKAPTSGP